MHTWSFDRGENIWRRHNPTHADGSLCGNLYLTKNIWCPEEQSIDRNAWMIELFICEPNDIRSAKEEWFSNRILSPDMVVWFESKDLSRNRDIIFCRWICRMYTSSGWEELLIGSLQVSCEVLSWWFVYNLGFIYSCFFLFRRKRGTFFLICCF